MIKLQHGYTVEADEKCYVLFKANTSTNRKGEQAIYKKAIGYYSRLSTVLAAYADELERQHIQDTDMTLSEAIKAVIEIRESLKKLIREAVEGAEQK